MKEIKRLVLSTEEFNHLDCLRSRLQSVCQGIDCSILDNCGDCPLQKVKEACHNTARLIGNITNALAEENNENQS